MTVALGREPGGALVAGFERWWQRSGAWVEPANQRRGGESGVQLLQPREPGQPPLYSKRQTGHLYRSLLHPFGQPTILRELHAYRAFARLGIVVPRLVYGAARKHQGQWQAVLVTEALSGFVSLEQWYRQARAGTPAAALTRPLLDELALTLARLHRGGWQHGCCYPKHVFVKVTLDVDDTPRVEVALLDLEKSRRRWRAREAARRDLGQLWRHRGPMPVEDWVYLRDACARLMVGRWGVILP